MQVNAEKLGQEGFEDLEDAEEMMGNKYDFT